MPAENNYVPGDLYCTELSICVLLFILYLMESSNKGSAKSVLLN